MSLQLLLLCIDLFSKPFVPTVELNELSSLEGSTPEIQRIYLIRHGESLLNLPDSDGVRRCQGASLYIALSPNGEIQVEQLFKKLSPKIEHLDLKLISSNALRAQQTIDPFSKHFGQDADIYPGLRELGSGPWEGQRREEAYNEAYKCWEELSPAEKFITPKMPGGESPKEVAQRAIDDLNKAIQSAEGKTIVGVCHSMTLNALTMYLNRTPLSDKAGEELPYIDIDNCDIILIEVLAGKPIDKGYVQTLIKARL